MDVDEIRKEGKCPVAVLAVLMLCVWADASAQTWPQEPTAFKGVPFGASRKEAAAIAPRGNLDVCIYSPPPVLPNGKKCGGPLDSMRGLGPARVSETFTFDAGDHFVRAEMLFESGQFAEVREIYLAKFGEPSERKSERVLSSGVQFDNEILTWKGAKVTVELRQYIATANVKEPGLGRERGEGSLSLNSYLAICEEEKRKAVKSF